MAQRVYEVGDFVYETGQEADAGFILLWGKLVLEVLGTKVQRLSEKGQCFGEIALLGDQRFRTENAKAITSCAVVRITKDAMERTLKNWLVERNRFDGVKRTMPK